MRYVCAATTAISPIPVSARAALRDLNWKAAMDDEYVALIANHTWELVPRPPGANVVIGKWVFCVKYKPDGSLDRYKARWVVRGFSQRLGIDFGEAFSPVVKPAAICTVLVLVASRGWPARQLDISNAFLHGNLSERVYCQQPVGFVDPSNPDVVSASPGTSPRSGSNRCAPTRRSSFFVGAATWRSFSCRSTT